MHKQIWTTLTEFLTLKICVFFLERMCAASVLKPNLLKLEYPSTLPPLVPTSPLTQGHPSKLPLDHPLTVTLCYSATCRVPVALLLTSSRFIILDLEAAGNSSIHLVPCPVKLILLKVRQWTILNRLGRLKTVLTVLF